MGFRDPFASAPIDDVTPSRDGVFSSEEVVQRIEAAGLPAPTTGDAGKVPTVNEAETGYELDTTGGGGGIDLSVYDDFGPNGFQIEYNGDAVAIGSTFADVPFDTIYVDTSQPGQPIAGVPLAVGASAENDWLKFDNQWNNPGDHSQGSRMHVVYKKRGLYKARVLVDLSGPLTHPAKVNFGGFGSGSIPAGASEFDVTKVILGGPDALDVTLNNDYVVQIQVNAADEALEFSYCWVSLIPVLTVPLT